MADHRILKPCPPLAIGEVVTVPSGRPAIVKSISPSGDEATVQIAGGELASFRQRWLSRPFGQPVGIVILQAPDATANDADPSPEVA